MLSVNLCFGTNLVRFALATSGPSVEGTLGNWPTPKKLSLARCILSSQIFHQSQGLATKGGHLWGMILERIVAV